MKSLDEIEGARGARPGSATAIQCHQYRPYNMHRGDRSFIPRANTSIITAQCDDVDNGLDNTCEVIRQETVQVSPVFITSWCYSLPLKLIT